MSHDNDNFTSSAKFAVSFGGGEGKGGQLFHFSTATQRGLVNRYNLGFELLFQRCYFNRFFCYSDWLRGFFEAKGARCFA